MPEGRCLPAILSLLKKESGGVSKYKAARIIYCDQRTAQRILDRLHKAKYIRICDWLISKGAYIPIYRIADGKADSPQVPVLTANKTTYQRKRRENPEVREKEAAVKRNNRLLDSPKQFGFWGI